MEKSPLSSKKNLVFGFLLLLAGFALGLVSGYRWGSASASQQALPTPTPRFVRYQIPTEGFPAIGPEDAPIVIVEFSDFQCPYCKRFHEQTFAALLAAYPGKIRFVYRNLPLTSIHPEAFPAAEASLCAHEQGAFWPYHDRLFQGELGQAAYFRHAQDLGLDMTRFQQCMQQRRYRDFIQNDMDFAINLGVRSTPTFFINGIALVGAQPLEVFRDVIDRELAGEFPKE
uniref:Thiol:disulfide interchange protein DsbA n=1 Tax=uncultured Chloroflexota bacterium TaxID=166587 RepID=H5SMV7_9CHLR|nr:thiol:disulfide interchange protein DsbA [uncultured Chloroflexota bacterium]